MYTITTTPDLHVWKRFVLDHPRGTVFHTPEMMAIYRAAKGYRPRVIAALDHDGQILALLTSVQIHTLPTPLGSVSSRSILFSEPICIVSEAGEAALRSVLTEHDRQRFGGPLFAEVRALHDDGIEKASLCASGYVREDYLNYLIDLNAAPEVLWSRMSNTCRANIRRAQRGGLTTLPIETPAQIDAMYEALKATFKRARVPLADRSLFRAALSPANRQFVKGFLALHQDRCIGTSVMLLYKERAYEWYWGVHRAKSLYPAEFVTWQRIEWAKEQGFQIYDFGGAGAPDKPYGVRDFKSKFGGKLVNYGRYRNIYAPWRLMAAERAYNFYRSLPMTQTNSQAVRVT